MDPDGGREDMGKVAWTTWLYILLVVGAAIAVLLHAPTHVATMTAWWVIFCTLAALFLVCDFAPTPLATRRSAWSPSSAATLAAVVMLGPVGAAMVGAVAVLSVRRLSVAERLFNGAMYALAGCAAGVTYLTIGRLAEPKYSALFPELMARVPTLPKAGQFSPLIWPFAVAAIVHVLVNHGLIWQMLRLDRPGRRGSRRTETGVPVLLVSDLGFAALGLVIAALWPVLNIGSAVVVLVPLMVARWAMGQFAEQRRAYTATIAALCQAVETKDFYTRGHSERVSRGSGMIARQIGMRQNRVEAVMFAGMLHDVGKLGVPTKVLQKEGALTEEEFAAIQLHPMRGLEIIGDIEFLTEALNGIMHHHERMDGAGYPMGFAGHEIPIFARIIAVADAFDSMTSTRSYRRARSISEAVAELRKGADSQFDPRMVEAFINSLDREGWRLPRLVRPPAEQDIKSLDHDDPTAPLRVVGSG